MPLRIFSLAFWFVALSILPARANGARLFPAEAAIPNSRVIRFRSSIDKKPYRLQISIPMFASRPIATIA